jgi:hypothetical protein
VQSSTSGLDDLELLALPVEEALPRFVHILLEQHRVDPALHRVFAEQLSFGNFPRLESSLDEGVVLMRAYLAAHADEIARKELDLAAFVLVHTADSLTHAAVITRPQLLAEPGLEREICACLLGYLKGR